MNSMKTKNLLKTLHRRIFNCYEFSKSIVSDRENQMISKFWQRICQKYEINSKLSSAHYFETNKQTENVNKIIKNYLRTYVRYAQTDWIDFFSNAKFAANNHENALIKMTSFFANHEYHFKNETKSSKTYDETKTQKTKLTKIDKIIARQKIIKIHLTKRLIFVQND